MSPSPTFLPPPLLRSSLPRDHLALSRRRSVSRRSRPTATQPVTTPVDSPSIATIDPFHRTATPPRSVQLPRPVIIVPGYAADSKSYEPMAASLRASLPPSSYVAVAPIRYHSWVPTLGGRPVTPILSLLHDAVQRALRETSADSVNLVAHSAAGWIARIYLGDVPYPQARDGTVWRGADLVQTLVCLGTPQRSAEPVTRKNMAFVNGNYPGSYHADVRYVCLAGDGGSVREGGRGHVWKAWEKEWFPRMSYALTDGDMSGKAVAGDGIVPLSVAFLEDADENIRLKGVWHSPESDGPWYGDSRVVDYWSRFLM